MRLKLACCAAVFGLCVGTSVPALAAPGYFKCERTDAPESLYLMIDDVARGALTGDSLDVLRAAKPIAADDFNVLYVNFTQFRKYDFDRMKSVLTKRDAVADNVTFQCQKVSSP
jgi:hypothetical protein